MKNKKTTVLNLLKRCFIIAVLIFIEKSANAQYLNSQFISMTAVPTEVLTGQTFHVWVTFKNTGTLIWYNELNNERNTIRYRLRSENPENNSTWYGAVRSIIGTTLPNNTLTIDIEAKAPTTPGYYNFQWRMWIGNDIEDVSFGDYTPNKVIMVSAPTHRSQFISQNVPSVVSPGQTFPVSITFKNIGTQAWTSFGLTNKYKLGSQNSQNNSIWGLQRVDLPVIAVSPTTGIVTFNFIATAPTTPGSYNFQWQMLQEGLRWFGETTPNKVITVSAAPFNGSQFVSQNVPLTVNTGQAFTASITLKNTGTKTWFLGGVNPHRLGTDNPIGNNIWGRVRVELPVSQVLPNGQVTFTFTATAPSTPGIYNFQWKMVQELVEWFGVSTPNVAIVVEAPSQTMAPNNSQFVSQSVPSTVNPGQIFTASVTFKNIGTNTWYTGGVNPYRLGSQNVQDNETWGRLRVELPVSQVLPNTNVTFNFTATAPSTPGQYNFQWKMVKELVEWFGAIPPNRVITVSAQNRTKSIIANNSQNETDFKEYADLIIMPNPATDFMNILLPIIEGTQALKIFDITGKIVYDKEYSNTSNIEINVSEFKKGIYFLKIDNQTNSYCKKFVIN